MRTIWQSLAWKEWHEHKWNFVSILAILGGVTALVALNADEANVLGAVQAMLLLSIVPLSMFIGMGVAAGERSRGTLPFLQALPVPMWRVAVHKFVAGLLTVVIPFLLVVLLTYGICQLLLQWGYVSPKLFVSGRIQVFTTGNWLSDVVSLVTYLGLCFFIWTIGTGANRKHEVSAAAVALLAMLGWVVALMLLWKFIYSFANHPSLTEGSPFDWVWVVGLSTIPGGLIPLFAGDEATGNRAILPVASLVALTVLVALAARYIRHFGRIADIEIRSPMIAPITPGRLDWLGPPRCSAFASIAWKQFREGWPAALAGLVIIFGLFGAIVVTHWRELAGNFHNQLELINALTGMFGFVIAMILGVSMFSGDVSPGLNTFWRSRPISPDMWFWTKFLAGLVIAVAAIYLPLLVVAGIDGLLVRPELNIIRMAQIAVFAAAVAMICLVRQPVYAAILSIAVVYLGIIATSFVRALTMLVRGQGWSNNLNDLFELGETQILAGLLATFVVTTLIAWLAVRNDWGQKSVR